MTVLLTSLNILSRIMDDPMAILANPPANTRITRNVSNSKTIIHNTSGPFSAVQGNSIHTQVRTDIPNMQQRSHDVIMYS